MKIEVDENDLLKILDILIMNSDFHYHRDKMNATLHLAKEPRYSPLTSETMSVKERLNLILDEAKKH